MIYDSVALYAEEWERTKEDLISKGWEQLVDKKTGDPLVRDGVTYIRKEMFHETEV